MGELEDRNRLTRWSAIPISSSFAMMKVFCALRAVLHRGALMVDGYIEDDNIICGVHNWDYLYDRGISKYNNEEVPPKFTAVVKDSQVWVDGAEIATWHL